MVMLTFCHAHPRIFNIYWNSVRKRFQQMLLMQAYMQFRKIVERILPGSPLSVPAQI